MTSNIHPAFRQDVLFAGKALIICSVKSIFQQRSQIAHRRYLSPVDMPCTTCSPLADEIARRGGKAGYLGGTGTLQPSRACVSFWF